MAHDEPFPWLACEDALPEAWCRVLEERFAEPREWVHQHGGFYECFMATVTDELHPDWRRQLTERLSVLFGVPLADAWKVTLQRMEPGQHALVHTDRPLVGYEAARLVVQLNRGWRPEHGGWFELYAPGSDEPVLRRPPTYNSAAAFVMRPSSHHAVSVAHACRRSVVFNFWHAGNTEALAAHVRELYADMRVDRLDPVLGPVMLEAEQRFSDVDTLRAIAVAWALQRWGADPAALVAGYRGALEPGPAPPMQALARWAARLHLEDFDVDAWQALRGLDAGPSPEARAFARLCRVG